MKLDEILHQAGRHKRRTRVGRGTGSGHGKTAGRGTKGYYSRSGAVHRMGYEGGGTSVYYRMPKRGFSNVQFARNFQVVNVSDLEAFPEGSRVDAQVLAKADLIARADQPVKVLGDGELKRKLTVAASKFSASAIKKIIEAGGTATTPTGEVVLPPVEKAPPAEKTEAGAKARSPGKAEAAGKAKAGGKAKDAGKAMDVGKSEPADKSEASGNAKPGAEA